MAARGGGVEYPPGAGPTCQQCDGEVERATGAFVEMCGTTNAFALGVVR